MLVSLLGWSEDAKAVGINRETVGSAVYACWFGVRRRDSPDCEACHRDAVM